MKRLLALAIVCGLSAAALAQGIRTHVIPQVGGKDVIDADQLGGTRGTALWDQSLYSLRATAVVDQEFPDFPEFSTYQVHDVSFAGDVVVNTVTVYFTQGFGFWGSGVNTARLNIFPKTSSLPGAGDDPAAGAVVDITLTSARRNRAWAVSASGLGIPLAAGDYWVGVTPIADFGLFGQEFHAVVAPFFGITGDQTAVQNPGGGFGIGSGWAGVEIFGFGASDGSIKIE